MYLGENHRSVPFNLGACCNRDLTSHKFLANENLITAFCEIGQNWHAKIHVLILSTAFNGPSSIYNKLLFNNVAE